VSASILRLADRPAPSTSRFVLPAMLAVAVVAVDQASKLAVVAWLGPDQVRHRAEVLGALLAFEYVENSGAAFGSFRGQSLALAVVALAIVAGLVVYYRRVARPSLALAVSLGLLVGGAVGNLIDRVRLGHVVDYFAVVAWPKFNVADAAVTVGVLLLVWHVLTEERSAGTEADSRGNDR
jgi:signal peptidase II